MGVFHVASCWPQMFKKFLESERTFPSRQLHHDLPAFLRRHSIDHNHLHVELRPWRLAWLCVSFRTQFDTHSSGQQTKPFMAAWEEFVSSEMRKSVQRVRLCQMQSCSFVLR